jgi:diguanylate cyclase (GGDEF)-like protein
VILQVENLKRLEDDYGPEAAEETMSEVGRRLAKVVRRSDPSGRIDDDQVAVLAPGCDREDLPGVAERVRQRVEHDAVETSAGSLKIELAAGSGSSRPHHDGIDPLALLDGARQDLGSQS